MRDDERLTRTADTSPGGAQAVGLLIALDALPLPACLVSDDRVVRATNEAFRTAFGERVGQRWETVFRPRTPDTPPGHETSLTAREGQEWTDELGRTFAVFERVVEAGDGSRLCVRLLVDITARRRLEESLRARASSAQAVIENSPIGISIRSPNGRLLAANAAWRKIWAIPEDEVEEDVSRDWNALVFDERDNYLRAYHDQVRALYERGGQLSIPELRVASPRPGAARWVSQHFYAITNAQGAVERVVILTEDITERKRAEELLAGLALVREQLLTRGALEEKLHGVTDTFVEALGADQARIWLVRPGDACETTCPHGPHREARCRSGRCLHLVAHSSEVPRSVSSSQSRVPWGYAEAEAAPGGGWAASYPLLGAASAPLGVLAVSCPVPIGSEAEPQFEGVAHTVSQVVQAFVAEEALAAERAFTDLALNSQIDTFFVFELATGKAVRWNRAFSRVTGYRDEEIRVLKAPDSYFREEDLQKLARGIEEMERTGTVTLELSLVTKEGREVPTEFTASFVREPGTTPQYVIAVGRDITERTRVEAERGELRAQLLQARKLESIGRLAGGVAHDFNNILQVILGHADLALARGGTPGTVRADLEEIRTAAERAADLTSQLLAFARRQVVRPTVIDLNETVEGALKMLRRLIGEEISLVWFPQAGLWKVFIDPTQVVQLLTNLCANARDAIGGVGTITIETANLVVDEGFCLSHVDLVPGMYVTLSVSDDGGGMTEDVLAHVFEPFFTTKEVGQGVGLGLATVYGIVKQNGGSISVYSRPGEGTSFRILLPRAREDTSPEPAVRDQPHAPPGGGETVLVVEDDSAILTLATHMLEGLGYTVLGAATPTEAVRRAEAHTGRIDLLITDIALPEMHGPALAERISAARQGIKRLFISGHSALVIAQRGILEGGAHYLQKPFTLYDLAVAVRAALEG